jgi:hypothetical protein
LVCLLGAWIGNKTEDLTPLEVVINLIKEDIERWQKIHPTLYSKRLIVQAIVGGRTQYLTKVQGMPTYIENTIQKIIQEFIWDGENSPRIRMNTLQQLMKQGGLNLLDIRARNEAIDIMRLKD